MVNKYSNHGRGNANRNNYKQNWMKQKKIILIKVQVCRTFLPVDITGKQDFDPNVKVKKGFLLKKPTKCCFDLAKQINSTTVGKQKGGITRNTAQTQSGKEKSIMGEFPEKNELHLSHRWHAM